MTQTAQTVQSHSSSRGPIYGRPRPSICSPAAATATRSLHARSCCCSFLPLARKLARRYSHSSMPDEDLVQVASIALLKAIDRFDPARGSAFQSFAIPTILGELRRHFRDTSWAVHVARAAQERALAVQETIDRLSARHGHSPTVQEIAVYLELSEEEVLDGMQAGRAYSTMSLDAPAQSSEDDSGRDAGQRTRRATSTAMS